MPESYNLSYDWIIKKADSWRIPDGVTYKTEIHRRMDYLDGSMESDGLALLKQEFPKTYEDMQDKMIEFALAKHIIEKKAQVFRGKGSRFYLRTGNGEEVPPDSPVSQSFSAMLKKSQIEIVLRDLDKVLEAAHDACVKVWFDRDHVELALYHPDKAHLAVNPDRDHDAQSSIGAAFERTGTEGVGSTPRYEVWGAKDPEKPDSIEYDGSYMWEPSIHYMHDTKEDKDLKVNENNENPFKDRYTGKPIYPFQWFQDQKGSLYRKGGDDLVRFNRIMNLGLTYLHHNMTWQMAATPTFELPTGQADQQMMDKIQAIAWSPNTAVKLPPGVKVSFVRPDAQLEPFLTAYEMLVKYHGIFNQLAPRQIDIKGGLPPSGISLMIEFDNLTKYREEKVEVLYPQVVQLLEVMIVVWNTYATGANRGYVKIPAGIDPDWDPGIMDTGPVDYNELGARYERDIRLNVATPDHYYAAIHGVELEEAKEAVDANMQRNQEILQASTRYPVDPQAAKEAMEGIPVDDKAEDKKQADSNITDNEAGAQLAKVNVYQLAKAIEADAATAIDMRMALFTEDYETAKRRVEEAVAFNLEMARLQGEKQAAGQEPLIDQAQDAAGGPGGTATKTQGTQPGNPAKEALKGIPVKPKKQPGETEQ